LLSSLGLWPSKTHFGTLVGVGWRPFAVLHHCLDILSALRFTIFHVL
jgi:hypothetical protein